MNQIDKYFDKFSFAGLVLIMPSTIITISILLKAFDSEVIFRGLFEIKRTLNPYIVINAASLLSFVICFTDIIRSNGNKISCRDDELFIYRKSFLNLSVIFVNVCYILFIYLYYDLVKLGNIPVGRD